MNAKMHDDIGEVALAEILAASGVKVEPEDIAAVARAVVRIANAAASRPSPSFDDTNERFYRLLG